MTADERRRAHEALDVLLDIVAGAVRVGATPKRKRRAPPLPDLATIDPETQNKADQALRRRGLMR